MFQFNIPLPHSVLGTLLVTAKNLLTMQPSSNLYNYPKNKSNTLLTKKELKHQLCVYGYIRRNCIIYEIPQVLKELCYVMTIDPTDKWNPTLSHSDLIYLYKNSNHICQLIAHQKSSNKWRNCYGSLIVKYGEIQIWQLQIINNAHLDQFGAGKLKRSVMIGIISIFDKKHIEDRNKDINPEYITTENINAECESKMVSMASYFCDSKYKESFDGYAFYAFDGNLFSTKSKRKPYGSKWDRGDIITMKLDMTGKNGKLSFRINNKDQGVAFNDIDITKKYCLAVSFFFEEEVEIMNE